MEALPFHNWYWDLIFLGPVLGLILGLVLFKKKVGVFTTLGMAFSTFFLVFLCLWNLDTPVTSKIFNWWHIGSGQNILQVDILFTSNRLTLLMGSLVGFIATLVFWYSTHYEALKGDKSRYYAGLVLFTFAMMGIVFSGNLLLTFVFWELVGFSSWFLIGYWHHKPEAARAARKAFLVNRIGDIGFIIALMLVGVYGGTFDIEVLLREAHSGHQAWMTWAGAGLLLAVIGKSAQFPLLTWLPDAMEGPTPVSALLHAATMVAAGVFLLVRMFDFLAEPVLTTAAFVGGITAFMGAFAAWRQEDIKKVLAFSTISQLGFMIASIGAGYPQFAFLHLFTHAFFKAGLFLGAGVMAHHANSYSLEAMGGMLKKAPWVTYAFIAAALALAGVPLFSGFISKEAILAGINNWTAISVREGFHSSILVSILLWSGVFLTAVYVARMLGYLLKPKNETAAVSTPNSQLIPVVLLGIGSIWLVAGLLPWDFSQAWIIDQSAESIPEAPIWMMPLTISLIIFGGYLGYRDVHYTKQKAFNRAVTNLSRLNWQLDAIYNAMIVAPTLWVAGMVRIIDKKVLDGLYNGAVAGFVVVGHFLNLVDRYLVDGTVHLSVYVVRRSGVLAKAGSGSIQAYLIWAALFLLVLIITVFFMFIGF